jgi:hypothetical protein
MVPSLGDFVPPTSMTPYASPILFPVIRRGRPSQPSYRA